LDEGGIVRSAAASIEAVSRFQGSAKTLDQVLRAFLGSACEDSLPAGEPDRAEETARASAVVRMNATAAAARQLAHRGYTRQYRFAVLPSRTQPRWLLPLTSEGRAIDGFELYTPYSPLTRLLKALVVGARATGWNVWARRNVLVAARAPLALEKLAIEVTGEKHVTFAFSIGTPTSVQKLTVQLMDSAGAILGYMKMPLKSSAEPRLRHEADVLQKLHSFPQLRAHIPNVLFAGDSDGRYVLFQSAINGKAGPVRWTHHHEEFLNTLHGCASITLPGRRLVQNIAQRWNQIAPRLATNWQRLGHDALKSASNDLDTAQIACGIHHGDFVSWNTRVDPKKLFVFDWESAAWEAPVLWDKFHFLAQTECHLDRNPKQSGVVDVRGSNRALYLLYLLNSVAQLSDEESAAFPLKYREGQLLKYISKSVQTAVAD
jgi:hypothetical protein